MRNTNVLFWKKLFKHRVDAKIRKAEKAFLSVSGVETNEKFLNEAMLAFEVTEKSVISKT